MTRDTVIYLNGAYAQNTGVERPYVWQRVCTRGYEPLLVAEHIDVIEHTRQRMGLGKTGLDESKVCQIITDLLRRNGYSAAGRHIVQIRNFIDGGLAVICEQTSLYDRMTLRAVRPTAAVVEAFGDMAGLPTSAVDAATRLMHEIGLQNGCKSFVEVDRNDHIVSLDGSAVFAVSNRKIVVTDIAKSVESTRLFNLMVERGRDVKYGTVLRKDLATIDELFTIDHRGITSVGKCEGRIYSDIIAATMAEIICNEHI